MLVDINLLPQKENKHSWAMMSMIVGLFVLVVLVIMGWIYYQSLSQKADSLSKQSSQNELLLKTYQKNVKSSAKTPSDELRSAVDWAQANRKESYLLLQSITSLLPERGFIQTFSFEGAGTATLSVQFESTREAADFLDHLQTSSCIKKVELQTITAANAGTTNAANTNINSDKNVLPRYVATYRLGINLQSLHAKDSSAEVSQ